MKILQRYILKELLLNFCFTLTVITSVFFIAVSVQTLYRFQQLSFLFVLQILPQFVPYSLAYTIPMSAMIGVVLTYGRLSADHEITAMRTSGMHLWQVLTPSILIGLFTVVVCFVLQANVIPYCQYKKRTITKDAVARLIADLDTETDVALGNFRMSWEKRDEEGRFHKLLLLFEDPKEGASFKFIANSGLVYVDQGILRFTLSGVHTFLDRSRGSSSRTKKSSSGEPISPFFREKIKPKPDLQTENLVSASDDLVAGDIGARNRSQESSRTFSELGEFEGGLEIETIFPSSISRRKLREFPIADLLHKQSLTTDPLEIAEIQTELQMRYSLSLAGLCFVLIGTPLGILFRRGNRLGAFLVSFLLIMTLYYPLLMFGEAFGETGRLHPVLAVWSANIVLGSIGLTMLFAVLRQ